MSPAISVIVPNYNHAAYLTQRINSILDQTYQHFEVIILDDCSTDNSRQVIESYRNRKKIAAIIYNDGNSGSPFLQWKKGIALAKNEWIWIAESDDMADPSFLQTVAQVIVEFPAAGIFYTDSFVINENNEPSGEKFSERKNGVFHTSKWSNNYFSDGIDEINEHLKFDCTINNISSVIFRKDIFTAHSDQLNDFKYYGDWFFLLKASFSTGIYYLVDPLNFYRKHGSSLLNSETSLITSRKEYFTILQMLYYHEKVTEKKRLLDHFAYHYLSFGLSADGLKKGWVIIQSYLKADKRLAWKVIQRILAIKVFRQKRPFFVTEKRKD